MNPEETLAIVRSYHQAWTTTKNFDLAASLLADDLQTDLPVNVYTGKHEFVEAITGFGGLASRCSANVPAAARRPLIYDLEMAPLGVLRMAEQLTVTDGKITFIRQIHDTATMRAAGFAPALPAIA